jgi:hypothetical protein
MINPENDDRKRSSGAEPGKSGPGTLANREQADTGRDYKPGGYARVGNTGGSFDDAGGFDNNRLDNEQDYHNRIARNDNPEENPIHEDPDFKIRSSRDPLNSGNE